MMILLLQLILYCVLFFLLVKLEARNDGWNCLYFYPKDYQAEVFRRGLADEAKTKERRKRFMTFFLLIMAAALIAIIALWNRVTDFWTAYFQTALFLVVMNWFDAIVLDRIWVGKSKIWEKPEMAGFPYLKPWSKILSLRIAATVIYLILAFPMAGLCVWLARLFFHL